MIFLISERLIDPVLPSLEALVNALTLTFADYSLIQCIDSAEGGHMVHSALLASLPRPQLP